MSTSERDVLEFTATPREGARERVVAKRDGGQLVEAVIRGVKLLGPTSKNVNPDGMTRNVYPFEMRKRFEHLYEGAPVYADHPATPSTNRKVEELLGVVKNARAEQDGTYGDLVLMPRHPMTERVLWAAENSPKDLGMSHNAKWGTSKVSGRDNLIESMEVVRSVDVVTKPATTGGLFESQQEGQMSGATITTTTKKVVTPPAAPAPAAAPAAQAPKPAVEAAAPGAPMAFDPASALAVLDDAQLDDAGKLAKLRELIAALASAPAAPEADPTAETASRREAGASSDVLEEIRRELRELKAQRSGDALEALIQESGLEAEEITPAFRKALVGQPDARVRELLEDRRQLIGAGATRPTSRDAGRATTTGAPAAQPQTAVQRLGDLTKYGVKKKRS